MTTGKSSRNLLNELPSASPWPARLLGVDRWAQREKTRAEIEREFEREKWGAMLRHFQDSGASPTLGAADAWIMGDAPSTICAEGDELIELSVGDSQARYRDMVCATLARYLPTTAFVELGAGYGSIAIDVARRPELRSTPVLAAELTRAGASMIEMIARAEGVPITVGRTDLHTGIVTELDITPGAILYTAYSACYVPRFSRKVVENLSRLEPKAVIHFEPLYEHCDSSTLLGLMRRKYIDVNDYNTNLLTVLQQAQAAGAIRVVEERPPVYGPNPFLVASIVVWEPL